ncbi:MAG: hypothetical protein H0S85_04920 [Desulfovibrionaceae bacterium]|nr:hypothetical protein [Desulfovibrionaceae bacterium]
MPEKLISPEATLLDLAAAYPSTQDVFRARDAQAGECLLCNALFETVRAVAERYGLDLADLLTDLEKAARRDADAA